MLSNDAFPLVSSGYERVRAENDRELTEFAEKIDRAEDVVELRRAWMECPLVDSTAAYVSETAHERFAQAAIEALARLGVDPEADDERVDHLLHAIETAQADDLGSYSDGLHSPVMTGFYRIISACDPEAEGKLALRAPQALVDKALPGLREVALEFTDGDEYAEPSRFPVKAEHIVTDPESPFWGFSISTDTWPGRGSENIAIRMPSGLTTGDEILRTAGDVGSEAYLRDDLRYFPRSIIVQDLQLGRVSGFTRQVDTDGGLVAEFIELVKAQNGSAAGATSSGVTS